MKPARKLPPQSSPALRKALPEGRSRSLPALPPGVKGVVKATQTVPARNEPSRDSGVRIRAVRRPKAERTIPFGTAQAAMAVAKAQRGAARKDGTDPLWQCTALPAPAPAPPSEEVALPIPLDVPKAAPLAPPAAPPAPAHVAGTELDPLLQFASPPVRMWLRVKRALANLLPTRG